MNIDSLLVGFTLAANCCNATDVLQHHTFYLREDLPRKDYIVVAQIYTLRWFAANSSGIPGSYHRGALRSIRSPVPPELRATQLAVAIDLDQRT